MSRRAFVLIATFVGLGACSSDGAPGGSGGALNSGSGDGNFWPSTGGTGTSSGSGSGSGSTGNGATGSGATGSGVSTGAATGSGGVLGAGGDWGTGAAAGTGSTSSGGGSGGGGGVTPSCDLPVLTTQAPAATALLTVVNWAGKQAAISYTFDDSSSSQTANYSSLNGLGVPLTFYLTTNWTNWSSPVWEQAVADGHEIGNHSASHPQTGTGSELDTATAAIEDNLHVTPLTMAAPNGDDSYATLATSRFLFNRDVDGGSIAPKSTINRYKLPTFLPGSGANKAALDSGVSSAVSQGRWQTVLVHGFTGGGDGAYNPVPLADFLSHVRGQRDSGLVWIDTLLNVGAYFIGQKLISDATPQVSGGTSTWSWTLPDHFPEGRCVRVLSTGTVMQGGVTLAKNAQGYYDVPLDPGQVSVVAP